MSNASHQVGIAALTLPRQ